MTAQPGIVSAYETSGGKLVWRYIVQASATDSQPKAAAANVFAAPIVADGTLYVVSDDGTLSAFRADAADNTGPELAQLAPASASTVPTDALTYGALIVDAGSGIRIVCIADGVRGHRSCHRPPMLLGNVLQKRQ